MTRPVRVGLVGSQFISTVHAEALGSVAGAELVAAASTQADHVRSFAQRFGIPHACTDYQKLLEMDEIDMVVLGVPNDLHCEFTARRGGGRQARGLREAAVPEPAGGRPDDRRLPAGRASS